jgi:L-asparaginase II
MNPLHAVSTRGGLVESSSNVDVAVVDVDGHLFAAAGTPARSTWWRSAAKPFQAAACVRAGAADRFGFDDAALALACASHSSEDEHRAVATRMLAACGCVENDLACGGHAPLSSRVHERLVRDGVTPTPLFSNCSGKHAAMLALARHLDVSVSGYERSEHRVQQHVLHEVLAATGLDRGDIALAGDGCRATTFHVPLVAMARAWARLSTDDDAVTARLRRAMVAHPTLVAGADRACTAFLAAGAGRVVVKVGAEGVYCAALPGQGLGIALKVDSGDGRMAPVALGAVLDQLDERLGLGLSHEQWQKFTRPAVLDTRGDVVGRLEPRGTLSFPSSS